MPDQIRAFLAISIEDKELTERISSIQQKLDTQSAKMKIVKPENIHFTMKFLGDTPVQKLDIIRKTFQDLVFDRFQIDIGRVGAFPNPKRPRVIWVGVETNAHLIVALKEQIDTLMKPLGYKPERRKFTPHATIARVRRVHNREGISENIEDLATEQAGSMTVSSVKMMKSQLTPSGPIYTELWAVQGQ